MVGRKKEKRQEKMTEEQDQQSLEETETGETKTEETETAGIAEAGDEPGEAKQSGGVSEESPEVRPTEIVEEEPGEQLEEETSADSEIQALREEKEELLERIKRKQAEMDNLRRISKKEQNEAREYALYDFLGKLLPVLDNLERGLETARNDEQVPESYTDGLEMIYRQLYEVLEQAGVCVMEAEDMPFDPHCHHAVMEVDSEETEPGNVAEVLQKGYWHHNRVLRPAMVKVCRE